MLLSFEKNALEDLSWWLSNDRATAARILKLLEATIWNPRDGIGKPEQLRGFEEEIWSRRITLEHRLVYVVRKDQVIVQSCRYHYQ